jgi:crotonyl-CoA carboxylase/reductase
MSQPAIVEVGHLPDPGVIPQKMYAQALRSDRLGDPRTAFVIEQVDVPSPGPHEVLIAVMAAGINYNNVWAARGVPVDVIAQRQRAGDRHNFHIGGSDASGIVYAVGTEVTTVEVGQHVVTHPGYWDPQDPWVLAGHDPMLASSAQIWGYNTNFGSFGQFALVQEHQCLPKAGHLSWEEAAAPGLVGTTAHRMLHGWAGHVVQPNDVVLIWGGSGGLGGQAIQLARLAGAMPVAVVGDDARGEYCLKLGALGYVNRTDFSHWGVAPQWDDKDATAEWTASARAFGKRIWDIVGSRRNPRIVFEHPGQDTLATSLFVCDRGGMVVICAGTTGYSPVIDLRHLWVSQKRIQGSHGTNDEHARAYNDLMCQKAIDPCLGETVPFANIGTAHYQMGLGETVLGNRVALVGAHAPGLGRE